MTASTQKPSQSNSGLSLNSRILIGLILGIVVGLLLRMLPGEWVSIWLIDGLFNIVGRLFINALQMLVVPLVVISLICGASALGDPSRLGRLGGKTLGLYLFTTAVAVTLAITAGILVQPGSGADLTTAATYTGSAAPSLIQVLTNLIPTNPIQAMASGNMIPIIIFSLLVGVSITLAGAAGERTRHVFEDLNSVVMRLVSLVMHVAPYGVFALITRLAATTGGEIFGSLAVYIILVLTVLILHLAVTYSVILFVFTRLNPMIFLRKMRAAWLFAFSTASSNATIPVTLRTVEKRLGADNSIASFTVPLGATINMDGTAIMQGIATAFIAQAYGIDLTITQYLTVVIMVIMASIGAAGVPGVGIILLATVLAQVGLPQEGIALILGVDRILDMARTAVNITGDAMVTTVVAKSEGELDESIFHDPNAGLIQDGIHEPDRELSTQTS